MQHCKFLFQAGLASGCTYLKLKIVHINIYIYTRRMRGMMTVLNDDHVDFRRHHKSGSPVLRVGRLIDP